jgi:hypothetical protein
VSGWGVAESIKVTNYTVSGFWDIVAEAQNRVRLPAACSSCRCSPPSRCSCLLLLLLLQLLYRCSSPSRCSCLLLLLLLQLLYRRCFRRCSCCSCCVLPACCGPSVIPRQPHLASRPAHYHA